MESCRLRWRSGRKPSLPNWRSPLGEDGELARGSVGCNGPMRQSSAAFDDVPLPDDLAERVLRRLRETAIQSSDPAGVTFPEPGPEPPALLPLATVAPRPSFISRRLMIAGLSAVAASAAVAAVIWLQSHHTPSLTPGQVSTPRPRWTLLLGTTPHRASRLGASLRPAISTYQPRYRTIYGRSLAAGRAFCGG